MTKEWFISKNDIEAGPFDKQEILLQIQEGLLTPNEMIRKKDTMQWHPLGKIKGLFPEMKTSQSPPVSEPEVSIETTETEATITEVKDSFMSRLFSNAKIAVTIAAKNVSLKNMKLSTLPKALQKLGQAAYNRNIGETVCPDLYRVIKEISERIEARQAPATSEGKIQTKLVDGARTKIANEKDVLNRNRKFAELGQTISELPDIDPDNLLADELRNLRHIQKEYEMLQEEIGVLSKQGQASFRKKVVAVVVILLVIVSGSFAWRILAPNNNAESRYYETLIDKEDKYQNELEKAKEESRIKQAEMEAKQKEREKERLLLEEKRKLTQEENNLQRKLEAEEREREREQRALEASERSQQKKLEEEIRLKEAQLQQIERDRQAQEDRKRYAEKLFSSISLDPNNSYLFSNTMKERGIILELRGKGYDELSQAHAKKDWLTMLEILSKESYTEYPVSSDIDSAFSNLGRSGLQMLLRGNFAGLSSSTANSTVHVVDFWNFESISTTFEFEAGNRSYSRITGFSQATVLNWTPHPDGIGYYRDWSPFQGKRYFIYGNKNAIQNESKKWNTTLNNAAKEYREKIKLGEMSVNIAMDNMRRLYEKTLAEALDWCSHQ